MLLCELDERAISPRSGAERSSVDDLAEPMKTKKNAGHKAQHIS